MPEPSVSTRRLFLGLFIAGIMMLVFLSLFPDFIPPYKRLFASVTLDNALHCLAFALLGMVTPLAFRTRKTAVGFLLALLLLGLALEYWQIYIPNRRGTLSDASANAIGLFIGSYLGFRIRAALPRSAR